MAQHGRMTQLDGIRAVAIAMVFLNHTYHVRLTWAGVDLFFVLSGFLITRILLGACEQPLAAYFGHFYSRRARRILPPYLLLLLITPIFFGFQWLRHWYFYIAMMNLLDVFSIASPESFKVLWSLALEEQFYLVWPFAVYFLSEKNVFRTAAALVLLAPLLRYTMTPYFHTYEPVYMLLPFRMDLLAMGGVLAVLWRKRQTAILKWGQWGLLVSAFGLGLLVLAGRTGLSTSANTPAGNLVIYESTLIFATGIILWALSGRWVGMLQWGPMQYLGRISYSFYLIHLTIILVLKQHIGNLAWITVFSLAISLAYSALSWRYLETPILGGQGLRLGRASARPA